VQMLEQPEVAAEVDVRQRMKAGLERLAERGELNALLADDGPARRSPWFAFAAAAVLLLGFGLAYWRWVAPEPIAMAGSLAALTHAASANAVSATYVLASTRTRPDETRISARSGDAPFTIQVATGSASNRFTASLLRMQDGGTAPVVQGVPVTGTVPGLVDVYLNPAALTSGQYLLQLTPEAGGAPEEFSFSLQIER
jgi:hypothetical protein